jgi:hypothetical protein
MAIHRELTLPMSAIGSLGPDRVIIGHDPNDEIVYVDREWRPGLQATGAPRSGKGGFLRNSLCHDLAVGNEVIVLEPKPGEFGWLDGPYGPDGHPVRRAAARAHTPEGMSSALDYAIDVFRDRQQVLESTIDPATGRRGVDNFRCMEHPFHHLVLYLDEMPAICGPEAKIMFSKAEVQRNTEKIAMLAKQGPYAGLFLIASSQYATVEGTYGNNELGAAISATLAARIHFDRDSESVKAALRGASRADDKVLTQLEMGYKGRAVFALCREQDGGAPGIVQITWIEPDEAMGFAVNFVGPEPQTFEKL